MAKLTLNKLIIANKKFNSRLIVGTGKYRNMNECAKALEYSGAEIVTVAVRRVNIFDKKKPVACMQAFKVNNFSGFYLFLTFLTFSL